MHFDGENTTIHVAGCRGGHTSVESVRQVTLERSMVLNGRVIDPFERDIRRITNKYQDLSAIQYRLYRWYRTIVDSGSTKHTQGPLRKPFLHPAVCAKRYVHWILWRVVVVPGMLPCRLAYMNEPTCSRFCITEVPYKGRN